MKKIAIVTKQMIAGGVEKSLISMLKNISKEEYDVTLFVTNRGGAFEKDIPNWVKVKCIYGEEKTFKEKLKNIIKQGQIFKLVKCIIYTLLARNSKSLYKEEFYLSKILPIQDDEYDLAIAYHGIISFPIIYVSNHLKAKKKVAWIHTDIETYKKQISLYEKYYYKYDNIFAVSKEAKDKFLNLYPQFKDKVSVFYNIISKETLNRESNFGSTFNDNFSGIKILTIGRLAQQKNQIIIPSIVSKLKDEGYKVRWYCIGEGEDRKKIEEEIDKYNVVNEVILLGTQTNPYKYLQDCDIYVQPSIHECYCTTVTEAKCFNKPMVITDVNGSKEQIINEVNGLIVECNANDIYNGIKRLLDDKKLTISITKNLSETNTDTTDEIRKLYDILI